MNNAPHGFMEMLMSQSGAMEGLLPTEPKKLKCPCCNAEHPYVPAPTTRAADQRCSHDARLMFISSTCPVCLEDDMDPPMVGMDCGHIVCIDDFKRLGGKVGQEASKPAKQVLQEERASARRELQENGPQPEDMERLMMGMASAGGGGGPGGGGPGGGGMLAGMREMFGPEVAAQMFGPEMARMMGGPGGPFGGQDDFDDYGNYDEDYDEDEDEDDEDSDEDLPTLLNQDGSVFADANIPGARPVPPARARPAPAPRRNRNPRAQDSDDSSDEEMPFLLPSRGRTADSSDDDSDGDLPPLLDSRGGANADDSSDSDDESDAPPALLARDTVDVGGSSSGSDSDESDAAPDLQPRTVVPADSDAEGEGGEEAPPPLQSRREVESESDDSDSDVPFLMERDNDGYSSSDSNPDNSGSDESGDDMPGLLDDLTSRNSRPVAGPPRPPANTGSRSTRSRNRNRNRSTAVDSDSDDSDGSGMPSLFPTRRPDHQSDSDDDASDPSDDNEEMPGLLNPSGRGGDYNSSDNSSDSDMPDLLNRATQGGEGAPNRGRSARAAAAAAAAEARAGRATASTKTRGERMIEAKETARKMKMKVLKRELKKRGVTINSVEKDDYIRAYADAVVHEEFGVEEAEPEPEPVPVDPFANLPALVPSQDLPPNGAWILAPSRTDDSKQELQYSYVDGTTVKTEAFGEFAKGANLITGLDGAAWVRTPPSSASSSNECEIHRVDPIFKMKLFDVDKRAFVISDGHFGHWALSLMDKENPRSERKLVFVANKFSQEGKTVRERITSSSSLFMDKDGGVWVHVPKEGSSAGTIQPGLWHFTAGESNLVVRELDDESVIVSDSSRRNLIVLSPGADGSTVMFRVQEGEDREEQELDLEFEHVQAIVDDGEDGVYVHCRRGGNWKLCRVSVNDSQIQDACDCPKNSKITSDTTGGVWIFKKAGKAGGRSLANIDSKGNAYERQERFAAGCKMGC